MKKLRIALIAPQPFIDIRGTSMANLRLTQVLSELGHAVDVITYPFGSCPDYPGVAVHRCRRMPGVKSVRIGFSPAKLLMDVSLAWRASRLIHRGEYDCIQGVEEGIFIAMALGRLTGTPVVYDMDSIMSYEISMSPLARIPGMVRLMSAAERRAIKDSALIMTICDSMADYVRRVDASKRVAVVPDLPAGTPPGGPDPQRARVQLPSGGAHGRRFIVYIGSLAGYQGMDILVSAMPKVITRHPDAALVVIGGDDKSIHKLSDLAGAARVADHVLFLGKRPPEQGPDFMALADVLVSPRRGGINPPAKIYAYMQSGRPMVCTDVPAHTTVLDPNSAVIAAPTVDGIADGICWALSHPDEAQRRADRAKDLVSALTPEAQTRWIQEAYDWLATDPAMQSATTGSHTRQAL